METLDAKIIKCSDPNDWYKDMIGHNIKVKRTLTTFAAYSIDGKRINFYDLEIKWK